MKTRVRVINIDGVHFVSPTRKDLRERIAPNLIAEVPRAIARNTAIGTVERKGTVNVHDSVIYQLFGVMR